MHLLVTDPTTPLGEVTAPRAVLVDGTTFQLFPQTSDTMPGYLRIEVHQVTDRGGRFRVGSLQLWPGSGIWTVYCAVRDDVTPSVPPRTVADALRAYADLPPATKFPRA